MLSLLVWHHLRGDCEVAFNFGDELTASKKELLKLMMFFLHSLIHRY